MQNIQSRNFKVYLEMSLDDMIAVEAMGVKRVKQRK